MIWILLAAIAIMFCLLPPARFMGEHRVNDLKRWKQFGGTLDRPPPPAPIPPRRRSF